MTSSTKTLKLLVTSTALATSLTATSALAQVTDEIIVTATKRASTIQDVPFSLNAVGQQEIQRTGAVNLEDVSRNVAG